MRKNKVIVAVSLLAIVAGTGIAQAASTGQRLKGRILLQVESHGEAWYVNPGSGERSYLGKPSDAFNVMRNMGIGITNEDLSKIQVGDKNLTSASSTDSDSDGLSDAIEAALGTNSSSTDSDGDGTDDKTEILNGYDPNSASTESMIDASFAKKQAGKILLQVQSHGEAWYVNLTDNKRYFLGQAADAYTVMRELGLGITNTDLQKINKYSESKSKASSTAAKIDKKGDKNRGKDASSTKDMLPPNDRKMGTTTAPQELITACSGLTEGASCSWTDPRNNTATGTCATINDQLMCKGNSVMELGNPRNQGGQGNGDAPQEKIDACLNLTEGASCSFISFNNATATGTCMTIKSQLTCEDSNQSDLPLQ